MSTTVTACPECEGPLRSDDSETVCASCGLVVAEDNIDHGPEWRSFEDDETNRERTGAPLTRSRHDRGLSTEIGRSTRLKGRKRRRMARMRRQHNRTKIGSKAERNQVYGFTEIRRLVSALGLSDHIRDRACVLFESAQDEDLLRGRSLEGFAAATVYATCRTAEVSRTIDEVVADARASKAELSAAYDALNRDLGLPTGPIDPAEYLARFASDLDLPQGLEGRARELVERTRELNHVDGRNPAGVAAGCLYTAADERSYPLTQAEAADAADVTPVTLRATYQALTDGD
ncbi:transcription initiation factor IIB [Halosimplex carlsbadense 2-9-1]|uniref:Transcription initiation factor IIB n=1 Tax=Halosimplex carlsbadense 2-9-1 TaxID=797114 RepID=M0D3X1_9EURY|nr:transcription initiation factor IIB family protein [Halosimplex carlsbadense]ELZ28859.1 transcription initiation factor IIB [Halosimplex carlsbadense 2-9-1]